jgi:lysozyme family protein
MSNCPVWWAFCQAPQRDGSADDTDPLDGAGTTRWGWTYPTWVDATHHVGRSDTSVRAFMAMDQDAAGDLARAYFWNRLGGEQLPTGPDVSFVDFCWNSGGAVRVVQHHLGVDIDDKFGPKTLSAMRSFSDPAHLTQAIHDWRVAYYDELGFKTTEPGLFHRADRLLDVAKALMAGIPPDVTA